MTKLGKIKINWTIFGPLKIKLIRLVCTKKKMSKKHEPLKSDEKIGLRHVLSWPFCEAGTFDG